MDLTAYDHILWDWNGTLLDDLDLCLDVINQLLQARDLPAVSRTKYREIFGFPVIDYYRQLGFDFSREPFEKVSTEFILRYEAGRSGCPLMPAAVPVLRKMRELGYTQSVLSASRADYLTRAVAAYNLDDYFHSLNGLDNHHAAGKIERGARLLRSQNLQPDSLLLIGDTLHDAEVAAALDLDCLLIAAGHHSRARLDRAGVPVLNSLGELNREL